MAELIEKSPCAGMGLPRIDGGVVLEEWLPGAITSVAPLAGAGADAALAPLGFGFPAPNTMAQAQGARIVWTGRGQAFVIGADAPEGLASVAALTDQSDGWAGLRLSGPAAADVLARLVPLDLSPRVFPTCAAARSLLGHMALVLMRPEPEVFDLLVFRSMARTAVHELETAMTQLAARTSE